MISRRSFLLSSCASSFAFRAAFAHVHAPKQVLFGTLTSGTSKGIYTATWNDVTGELGPLSLAATADNPTYLVKYPHRDGTLILSVLEKEPENGTLVSYLLKPGATQLTELSRQDTLGSATTYVSIHPDGRSAYVANYGGGSVTSFHIRPDGTLSPAVSHFQYQGKGPNAARQEKPHAHSAFVTPDGRYLLVNDLGLDRIVIYRINPATAELLPHEPEFWSDTAGAGPRHIAFHPNGHWVFNVNELGNTVDTLRWDPKEGTLTKLSTVGILPPNYPADKVRVAHASEIAVSKDGRFVYVNNRGHDSIACMRVDPKSGALTVMDLADNGGINTRHITLDDTERWLIATNQDSGNIAVIPRDRKTGMLAKPLHKYNLDHCMFTLFLS